MIGAPYNISQDNRPRVFCEKMKVRPNSKKLVQNVSKLAQVIFRKNPLKNFKSKWNVYVVIINAQNVPHGLLVDFYLVN